MASTDKENIAPNATNPDPDAGGWPPHKMAQDDTLVENKDIPITALNDPDAGGWPPHKLVAEADKPDVNAGGWPPHLAEEKAKKPEPDAGGWPPH